MKKLLIGTLCLLGSMSAFADNCPKPKYPYEKVYAAEINTDITTANPKLSGTCFVYSTERLSATNPQLVIKFFNQHFEKAMTSADPEKSAIEFFKKFTAKFPVFLAPGDEGDIVFRVYTSDSNPHGAKNESYPSVISLNVSKIALTKFGISL